MCSSLLTTKGVKPVEEIKAGDELIGPDGHHRVLDVAVNMVGKRALIVPEEDPGTILTEEHIVMADGMVCCELRDLALNQARILIKAEKANGRYYYDGLEKELIARPWKFQPKVAPVETKTYSPIVESGHWCYTDGGICVLLCSQVRE